MFTVAGKSKNNTEKVEHTPTCINARLYSQNYCAVYRIVCKSLSYEGGKVVDEFCPTFFIKIIDL